MANRPRALRRVRACHGVRAVAVATCAFFCFACARPREASPSPETPSPEGAPVERAAPAPREEVQVGYATWYGRELAGHRTASGERFDPNQMTAAHRTLPFGTWVEVKRVETGNTVRVRINDRGPWGHEGRIIDLSQAAAKRIDFGKQGLIRVEVRVVPGP